MNGNEKASDPDPAAAGRRPQPDKAPRPGPAELPTAQAENDLRKSEDRYRSLFDKMTEGFALHEIVCDERRTVRLPLSGREPGLQSAHRVAARGLDR